MSDQPASSPPPGGASVSPIAIEDELKRSYLDYAMSVIVSRALPDARDGLKPVHRRILYSMHETGNDWNKPYRKSARVVGDVMGKYHPHGDQAIYDALVRMAQDFSMRAPLVDGQGNFGSVDGDPPAAMRYTEVRRAKIAHALTEDIDKDTVEFQDNYDGSEREPVVLPARFPNLLVNGSSGIAVGMATNVPPHNLGEVIDACLAYIDDPSISMDALTEIVPGPDFPTGWHDHRQAGGARRARARARLDADARALPCGGNPQRPRSDHRHRASLSGEQGAPAGTHRRDGARQAHRRHLRYPRRERPPRHARGDRAEARCIVAMSC